MQRVAFTISALAVIGTMIALGIVFALTQSGGASQGVLRVMTLLVMVCVSAAALTLQLAMSPCFVPHTHYLTNVRWLQGSLDRKTESLDVVRSMYLDQGEGHVGRSVESVGSDDEGGNDHEYVRVEGYEEGLQDRNLRIGQCGSNRALPSPYGYVDTHRRPPAPAAGDGANGAKRQHSTRVNRVSAFINDATVGTLFTVLAVCLVIVSVPIVATQNWWGGVVLYSGLSRVLEILCATSLINAVPIHDNSLRQRLLAIARARVDSEEPDDAASVGASHAVTRVLHDVQMHKTATEGGIGEEHDNLTATDSLPVHRYAKNNFMRSSSSSSSSNTTTRTSMIDRGGGSVGSRRSRATSSGRSRSSGSGRHRSSGSGRSQTLERRSPVSASSARSSSREQRA